MSHVMCHVSRVTCPLSGVTCHILKFFSLFIFKALALWADAFYKSKCPSVCVFLRLSVCSLLRYRLTVFLPPLPEVGCQIFLEIRNPLGKVMERSCLTFERFCLGMVLNRRAKKKFFFCADFAGYNRLIPLICGL